MLTNDTPHEGKNPPSRIEGWDHSCQVLVYQKSTEYRGERWSIAYYHYAPPFDEKPRWCDFTGQINQPDYWWYLPYVSRE